MLLSLEIKNYAIIHHAHMAFDKGLNIITGETGAGKSILLGALGLTLGERADSKVLYNSGSKCIVEATFKLSSPELKTFFEEKELDFEEQTIVRREITTSGKSRAFINDTPVNLQVLKQFTGSLVNLHSQQETRELNEKGFQLSLVDFAAGNQALLEVYKALYRNWKNSVSALNELKEELLKQEKDLEYNSFLLQEIEEASLDGYVLEELEEQLNSLNNAESIKSHLFNAHQLVDGDENAALSKIREALTQLNNIEGYSSVYKDLYTRLNSCFIELEDLSSELDNTASTTEIDEEQILLITEKVNDANKLMRKHNSATIAALIETKEVLSDKVRAVNQGSNKIEALETKAIKERKELDKLAKELSEKRVAAFPKVSKTIENTLAKVGMPGAKFTANINQLSEPGSNGIDEVTLLFSANKGYEPQPLKNVASGGELSRVMLSVKAFLAKSTQLATMIFDEIDTGISGETAAKVAEVFEEISQKHQLISITHLPQIAAKANKHFFISKTEVAEKTATSIAVLDKKEQVQAIAKMLSGTSVSEASLKNAEQLIKNKL